MNKEQILELHKQHREGHVKYVYFLLAVAVSCIAFSAQKTSGVPFSWFQLPLGLSVVCWGLSFYFGCKHVQLTQMSLASNLSILKHHAGMHDIKPTSEDELAKYISIETEILNDISVKNRLAGDRQFNLLIWGGLLFIFWHLLGMLEASICI